MRSNHIQPTERLAVRINEAAKLLSVTRGTVKNWIRAGRLRGVSVTPAKQSAVLVPMSSIRELLNG